MPHSTATIPTDPTGALATGAVLVEVGQTNARRVWASINGTDFYNDQVDTDYEIRGYSYASCSTWVENADPVTYPSASASRLTGGAGLVTYRQTTVA